MKRLFTSFKRTYFPLALLCGIALLAIQAYPWSPTTVLLTQSPWTHLQTWDDWDGNGVFTRKNMSCEDDNNWTFALDSNLVMVEDTLLCEPDLPLLDTITSRWTLIKNETILRLSFADDAELIYLRIYSLGQNEAVFEVLGETSEPAGPIREKIILKR